MTNKIVIITESCDDEDFNDDYLAGKLVLSSGKELYFKVGDFLSDYSPDQFLDELGTVLNDALLISKDLDIEITIDESVEDLAEELDEGLSDKMYQVYKDFIRKEVI